MQILLDQIQARWFTGFFLSILCNFFPLLMFRVSSTPWKNFCEIIEIIHKSVLNGIRKHPANYSLPRNTLCHHKADDDVFDIFSFLTTSQMRTRMVSSMSSEKRHQSFKRNWEFFTHCRAFFMSENEKLLKRSLSENLECVLLIFAYRLTFFFSFQRFNIFFSFNSWFYCLLAFLSPQAVCDRVVSPRLILFGCKN